MKYEFTGKKMEDHLVNNEPIGGKHYISSRFGEPYMAIFRMPRGARMMLKIKLPSGVREVPLNTHRGDSEVVFTELIEKDSLDSLEGAALYSFS